MGVGGCASVSAREQGARRRRRVAALGEGGGGVGRAVRREQLEGGPSALDDEDDGPGRVEVGGERGGVSGPARGERGAVVVAEVWAGAGDERCLERGPDLDLTPAALQVHEVHPAPRLAALHAHGVVTLVDPQGQRSGTRELPVQVDVAGAVVSRRHRELGVPAAGAQGVPGAGEEREDLVRVMRGVGLGGGDE